MPGKLLLAFVLGIAAAAVLAACGAKENKALIPAGNAQGIERKVAALRDDVSSGQCGRVGGRLRDLRNEISRLPARVSVRLKSNLSEGATRLEETAASRCAENRTDTTTVDTTPTVTEATPTVTTPATTTAPPETTSTATSTPTVTETIPVPTTASPTTPSVPNGGAAAPSTP